MNKYGIQEELKGQRGNYYIDVRIIFPARSDEEARCGWIESGSNFRGMQVRPLDSQVPRRLPPDDPAYY